jgi:diguanylate cyclase (GGDEF)-like protein/PAS domain S-box-containing protein
MPKRPFSPGFIALLYAAVAILWIITSDQLLTMVSDDPSVAQQIDTLKGLIFVAVTAGLLYVVLRGRAAPLPGPDDDEAARPRRGGLILVFLALVLVIPVLGYGIVRLHGPELRQDEYEKLRAIAKLKAGLIEAWLDGHRANADILAGRAGFTDQVDDLLRTGNPKARQYVRARMDEMAEAYGYDIDLLAADGGNVFDPANIASDTVPPELLEKVLRSGEVHYRDLYREKTGHIHLDFIVPVVRTSSAGGRQAIGVVILHTPVQRFLFPLIQDQPIPSPSAETILTRQEGGSVLLLNELRHRKSMALSERYPLDAPYLPAAAFLHSGKDLTMEGVDYRGVAVLAAVRPIRGTPWHLVTKIDREEVMAPLKKLVFWVSQVAFLAIASVSVAVLLLWRQRLRAYRLELAARESRTLYALAARQEAILAAVPEIVMEVDNRKVYTWANPAGIEFFGADVLGKEANHYFLGEQDTYRAVAPLFDAQNHQDGLLYVESWQRRRDGARRLLAWRCRALRDSEGKITGALSTAQDITQRRQAEERLRQAATVIETTHEGVVVTDAEQRILMVNHAFCELTGYSEEEVLGNTPRLLQSGRQEADFYAEMWAAIGSTGHWQGEIWNRRKNGEIYPELLSVSAVYDPAGRVTHYVGVFADISRLKSSEAQLEFLAHHDPLTGLPNRLLLLSRLQHGVDVAHRENGQLALLMLDLDRFKDVNDSFGHPSGDELLQRVAERLLHRVRRVDTVSRLGGDEFTVLLEDLTHPQDAARLADGIITALSEPCRLSNGAELRMGVSVGISLYPDNGQTAVDLLQQADAALYRAKAEGRGCFKYFSDELTQAARERIELGSRLRRAIGENQLRLHYQPQVDIASGRIVGAEALVRWQDPEGDLIPPGRFIPVAEETGLISEIGAWVLRETCRQGRAWLDAGLPPLKLAVNLSPHQFRHGDISDTVAGVLRETGYPAAGLELELTESALMEREEAVVEMLDRLRECGVHLAIDDFGTGYSSLAYLKRFPLDVLKIDKSFVDDIPLHRDDMEIAAAIVAMGHTLGFKVLAEGVETAEQLAFLQSTGCDLYQGYLTSPPLPPEAFAELMSGKVE